MEVGGATDDSGGPPPPLTKSNEAAPTRLVVISVEEKPPHLTVNSPEISAAGLAQSNTFKNRIQKHSNVFWCFTAC